jgi:hypothetical protein
MWAGGERRLAAGFLRQSAGKTLESIVALEENSGFDAVTPLANWYCSQPCREQRPRPADPCGLNFRAFPPAAVGTFVGRLVKNSG